MQFSLQTLLRDNGQNHQFRAKRLRNQSLLCLGAKSGGFICYALSYRIKVYQCRGERLCQRKALMISWTFKRIIFVRTIDFFGLPPACTYRRKDFFVR